MKWNDYLLRIALALLVYYVVIVLPGCRIVSYQEQPGKQVFVKSWEYLEAPLIDCEDHANYLYWQLVEEGKEPYFVYLEARKTHGTDHVLIELDNVWIDNFRGVNREVSKREYLRHFDVYYKFTHHDNVYDKLGLNWHLHLLVERAYRM